MLFYLGLEGLADDTIHWKRSSKNEQWDYFSLLWILDCYNNNGDGEFLGPEKGENYSQ